MRKAISTRTRFEIFKRDGFTCLYCGGHPPKVMLHIDHIHPVSKGGDNDMDNLVTACSSCNFGKSDVELSSFPINLKDKSIEIAEREEQVRGYAKIMQAKKDRIEEDAWEVATAISKEFEDSINKKYLISIKNFVEKLGVHATLDAAEIASAKFPYYHRKAFMYFCGICWNRIKENKNG